MSLSRPKKPRGIAALIAAMLLVVLAPGALRAQPADPLSQPSDWMTAPAPAPQPESDPAPNLTIVPRAGMPAARRKKSATAVAVQLVAHLTADGQRIDNGLVWRIYKDEQPLARGAALETMREASPVVDLEPGNYIVNAAFGRAHLTRKISVPATNADPPPVETFVLNAGGLRVNPTAGGKPLPPGSINYEIYADRDQSDTRQLVMSGAKPGLIIRLNAGLYHIVSTYGDANAIVRSDITVEAGKLTEASIVHAFGKVTLKLVSRPGGEALPDTQWVIQTLEGQIVKESVGALPAHILAPGRYAVIAKYQGKAFRKDFIVQDGRSAQVEIVYQ